jgi:serine/threonine-protein kinase
MAPEQIRGERVTSQTDVFALTAVFYEMVTGGKAFPGDTIPAVIDRVLYEEPQPPSTLVPDLPVICDEAVRRGLHKDPSERFDTALDFVAALGGLAAGPKAFSRRFARAAHPDDMETQDLRGIDIAPAPQRSRPHPNRTTLALTAVALALPLSASTPARTTPPASPAVHLSAPPAPSGILGWPGHAASAYPCQVPEGMVRAVIPASRGSRSREVFPGS